MEIPGAPAGGPSTATVGVLQNVPAVLCGGLGAADGGLCFATQTIRVCTRVTSDAPFRAKACGELKSHTF